MLEGFSDGNGSMPILGLEPFTVPLSEDGSFIPVPEYFDAMCQNAFDSIMPTIKARLDTLNDIREFKDIFTIKDTIRKVLAFRAELLPRFKTLRKRFGLYADVHLQAEFNVATTVSDVCALHRALTTAAKRARALVAQSGRLIKAHRTFTFSEFDDTEVDSGDYDLQVYPPVPRAVGHNFSTRRVYYDKSVFHVEIQYNYQFTEFQQQHAALLTLLDEMGLNLNPAIIWNAIPWSFVVDWVLKVGDFLDRYKLSNMGPVICIRRFIWSIKRGRRISTSRSFGLGLNSVAPWVCHSSDVPVDNTRETAYRRWNVMPSIGSYITTSGLSLHEFSLGVSLITTVIARRNPRQWGIHLPRAKPVAH
jgi:hypothetical protein